MIATISVLEFLGRYDHCGHGDYQLMYTERACTRTAPDIRQTSATDLETNTTAVHLQFKFVTAHNITLRLLLASYWVRE